MARDSTARILLRPLMRFLGIEGATEIVINEPGKVAIEVHGEWHHEDEPSLTYEELFNLAVTIGSYTEQAIGPEKPILSAMLPDGERVQIVVPPAVPMDTVSITIRLPSSTVKPLEQYEADGTFSRYVWARSRDRSDLSRHLNEIDRQLMAHLEQRDLRAFLELAVAAKRNIAVVGDTGSGKTTLMKAMVQSIPRGERLITIEDVQELVLPHTNVVRLLYSKGRQGIAEVTPADLVASCMRMYPSRVLMAELRGSESFDCLKLMTTGHQGFITSFHAESAALAVERYVLMAKEHEQASVYDAESLKRLVALTLDIVLHITAAVSLDKAGRPSGKSRYVTEVLFDPVRKLATRFGDAEVLGA